MPHLSKSGDPPQGSSSRPQALLTSPKSPSCGSGFTKSKQSPSEDQGQTSPPAAVDPEATEPFPPDLFRLPIPDRVFSRMPQLSDAALRCLLALIHQSFRFDPEASEWTRPEKSFSRREIESAAGLSDQGTRNGLGSLEESGWVSVDRSGRSYQYFLRVEVPTQRFTYVPTTLLEAASDLPSTTALRTVLAVLRATWGWTAKENVPGETSSETVHRRWGELPISTLSQLTGRSEPAIREAIRALEGKWISRAQPGQGAYLYRLLPEALGPKSKDTGEKGNQQGSHPEERSSNPPTPNEVTPDRQRSYPPSSYRERSFRDKHSQKPNSKTAQEERTGPQDSKQGSAVPNSSTQRRGEQEPDFSDLPERKQSLAQKLTNAGVWADRAKECLHRYSAARVAANWRLWRQRKNDPQAPSIEDDGAFLCAAITDGYATVSGDTQQETTDPGGNSPEGNRGGDPEKNHQDSSSASLATEHPTEQQRRLPNHKEKISARRKQALIRHRPETEPEHFHRFRHGESPTEKQFLYFDPSVGGPDRRVSSVENASGG